MRRTKQSQTSLKKKTFPASLSQSSTARHHRSLWVLSVSQPPNTEFYPKGSQDPKVEEVYDRVRRLFSKDIIEKPDPTTYTSAYILWCCYTRRENANKLAKELIARDNIPSSFDQTGDWNKTKPNQMGPCTSERMGAEELFCQLSVEADVFQFWFSDFQTFKLWEFHF